MGENPTKVIPVTGEFDFAAKVASLDPTTLLVLYFHAPWAAPCAQMSTVLDALASTYPTSNPPKVVFLSVNAEELPDVSEQYDVSAVPYIVLQRGESHLETISGGDAAKVRAAVEKHAGPEDSRASTKIPPAQKVTRPAEQPLAPSATSAATNASGASESKNLSAYAPNASDPATAPQYSSDTANGTTEDMTARLTQLTTAAPVMLFMKGTPSAPQCGFSRQMVSILRENSVRYGFFNILADEDVRQGMKTFADWPTFPQLWMGGELVGGLDIVKEELDSDPSFFGDYSVAQGKRELGGPASADQQAQPKATVV